MRLHHSTAFLISGFIWFGIGLFLTLTGIFLVFLSHAPDTLGQLLSSFLGSLPIAQWLIFIAALLLGLMKGRIVLTKAVIKGTQRILQMPNPIKLSQIYEGRYYFLIAAMIGLGIVLKRLPIMPDIRGIIDVAVGAALLMGSFLYFRIALAARKHRPLDN